MSAQRFVIDFSDAGTRPWYSVNDNVMGGVSRGGLSVTEAGTGAFSGQLSRRNNGGFSSARTLVPAGSLTGYDGLEMRVRGDGRTYALLAAPAGARGSWQQTFEAPPDWQVVRVPFRTMALSVRGWRPPAYPPISGDSIQIIGFLISDKDERPFRLEVDWLRGYAESAAAPMA